MHLHGQPWARCIDVNAGYCAPEMPALTHQVQHRRVPLLVFQPCVVSSVLLEPHSSNTQHKKYRNFWKTVSI